jgi:hypothetical protein
MGLPKFNLFRSIHFFPKENTVIDIVSQVSVSHVTPGKSEPGERVVVAFPYLFKHCQ